MEAAKVAVEEAVEEEAQLTSAPEVTSTSPAETAPTKEKKDRKRKEKTKVVMQYRAKDSATKPEAVAETTTEVKQTKEKKEFKRKVKFQDEGKEEGPNTDGTVVDAPRLH